MKKSDKIFIVTDKKIIGANLLGYFKKKGFKNIFGDSTYGVNVLNKTSLYSFFKKIRPDYVFLTSVASGGILANMNSPAELISQNLKAQINVIEASSRFRVKKLIFFASSCIYPKALPQPMREEYLLKGEIEQTSLPYAISKICGIVMCQAYNRQYDLNYLCIVPATVFGPHDDFDLKTSHVGASLIRKFYQAKVKGKKEVIVWGKGVAKREFIYIDDLILACIFLLRHCRDSEIINVGSGQEISIRKLAFTIKKVSGFKGRVVFDSSRPEGVYRKLLDSSKIRKLGWRPKFTLEEGIRRTLNWYKALNREADAV